VLKPNTFDTIKMEILFDMGLKNLKWSKFIDVEHTLLSEIFAASKSFRDS